MQPVLIVDDQSTNVRILEEILGDITQLKSASSGEEALSLIEFFRPDLVLLDIMMPGMDGYEVCKKLRKNQWLAHTKIILVSGKATVEERLNGYAVGADDYVVKPFIPDELLAKAKVYLKLVGFERSLQNVNLDLEEKVRIRSEQLIRAERAAFLGAHTGEIVHNINNPLTVVMGNLNILKRIYSDNPNLRRMDEALNKLQDFIRIVLQANKPENQDTPAQSININDILKEELKFLELESFFKYKVSTKLSLGEISPIRGQASHFSQSFGNLIKNAIDAMYHCKKRELSISTQQRNDLIEISIADTGIGISPAHLAKIFDPFFTTKPLIAKDEEPVGTGLGLPSVKRMLMAYGSRIEVESTEGIGTTARITIPLGAACLQTPTQEIPQKTKSIKALPMPPPSNEKERLRALHSLNILDTASEGVFDDLTLVAASMSNSAMATIGFVDSSRQWFKSTFGLSHLNETPRDQDFSAYAIHGTGPLVIEDALNDERFSNIALVTGSPQVRFYAGVPLFDKDNLAIGILSVMDKAPRSMTAQQLLCLQALARHISTLVEIRASSKSSISSKNPKSSGAGQAA